MKKLIGSLGLVLGLAANAETVQVNVDGLNCALCSAEMKVTLKKVANADEVIPRLDCGKLFFDISKGKQLNVLALKETLLSNGFTMGQVQPIKKTAKKAGELSC